MEQYYRIHECWCCRVTWVAPVIFTVYTTNLSGEQSVYCPCCHERSSIAYPRYTLELDKD